MDYDNHDQDDFKKSIEEGLRAAQARSDEARQSPETDGQSDSPSSQQDNETKADRSADHDAEPAPDTNNQSLWRTMMSIKNWALGGVALVADGLLLTTMYVGAYFELTKDNIVSVTFCGLARDGLICSTPVAGIEIQMVMAGLLASFGTLGLVAAYFVFWRAELWRDLGAIFKYGRMLPIHIILAFFLTLIICLETYGWYSLVFEITHHRVRNPDGLHPIPRAVVSLILTAAQNVVALGSAAVYAKLFSSKGAKK